MNKPLFSICIPVYNDGKYIKECLDSLTNQDFNDYEILIIDDCSSDNSFEICKEYARTNDKITVFHNETNKGSLYSRDLVAKKSVGKYILFIDGDDYHISNSLKILETNIKKYNCDMLIFGIESIFSNGKIKDVFSEKTIQIFNKENRRDFIKKISKTSRYNSLCTKLIRRSIYDNLIVSKDDFNISRGTDKYMSLRLYEYIESVVMIPDVLYVYRQNNDGITMTQDNKFKIDYRNREQLKKLVYSEDCLTEKDIEDFDKYCYKRFKGQLYQIGNLKTDINKKISFFEEIKQNKYFKDYLCNLFKKYGQSIEIILFYKGRYRLLIMLEKIKKIIA